MTTSTSFPKVVESGLPRVALNAPTYRPERIILVFGAFTLFAGFIALAVEEPGFKILMGSLAFLMLVFGVGALLWQESILARRIRVDRGAGSLRFAPNTWVLMVFPSLAVLGLLPGVAALVLALMGVSLVQDGSVARFGPFGIGLISLGWLAQQAWVLRRPLGLTLTKTSVSGVRGTSRVDIRWENLSGVAAVASPGAKLYISAKAGEPIIIEPRWIGSDPNEVAAIIEYYREHPGDRHLLTDPAAAIRRVEESAAVR